MARSSGGGSSRFARAHRFGRRHDQARFLFGLLLFGRRDGSELGADESLEEQHLGHVDSVAQSRGSTRSPSRLRALPDPREVVRDIFEPPLDPLAGVTAQKFGSRTIDDRIHALLLMHRAQDDDAFAGLIDFVDVGFELFVGQSPFEQFGFLEQLDRRFASGLGRKLGINGMYQFGRRRRCDQFGSQCEEVSDLATARLGRIAPRLACDEVGDAPIGVDQLDLRATLELVAFGIQLAPGKVSVLRADQTLALRDQRPHPDHAALHPRLDDPHDPRPFAINRRKHSADVSLFSSGVARGGDR